MDASPLALLPPELRNIIYELALRQDNKVQLYYGKSSGRLRLLRAPEPRHPLALPATCKELYAECGMVLFSTNIFNIQYQIRPSGPEIDNMVAISRLVQQFGPSATYALRSVILDVGTCDTTGFEAYLHVLREHQAIALKHKLPLKVRTTWVAQVDENEPSQWMPESLVFEMEPRCLVGATAVAVRKSGEGA